MSVLDVIRILISATAIILALCKADFLPLSWFWRVVLLAGGVVLAFYQGRKIDTTEKQRALKHMADRPPLTEWEFGQRFFPPEQAELAAKLRSILAQHIPVDLSRLHPDDRIVEDIRMDALDSFATVEFIVEVEKEVGISIPDAAAEKMRTLRDVIDYVSQAKRGLAV